MFWSASCTKLLTSLAALQLVEANLWSLDRPVVEIIPELRSIGGVLASFRTDSAGKEHPVLEGPEQVEKITLRHLLTHTSGLGYDFLSPAILKWWAWKGERGEDKRAASGGAILSSYLAPLVGPVGGQWCYGPGVDFAGLLVERLGGRGRLGTYLQSMVWDRLGVEKGECVFRAADFGGDEEEKERKWVAMSMRMPVEAGNEGGVGKMVHVGPGPTDQVVDDLGGGGARLSPRAYIKVLESLLRNDGKLLRRESVEKWVFAPQFVDGSSGLPSQLALSLEEFFGADPAGGRMLTGGAPVPGSGDGGNGVEYNYSLVGCLSRKKGGVGEWGLHWGGLPNLQWFVDRKEGVAGLMAMQLLPTADPVCLDASWEFRGAVREELGRKGVDERVREGSRGSGGRESKL
jgi:CubicO group peptidase (beta-lactamase class C family)